MADPVNQKYGMERDAPRCSPGRGGWSCHRIRTPPGSKAVFPHAATGASIRRQELTDYQLDIADVITRGIRELGISSGGIQG